MTNRDPALQFTEIEHKFVLDETFDLDRFRADLAALQPTRTSVVRVVDRYFLLSDAAGPADRRFVIRHRYDPELHQLTIKTIDADPELRTEINLDLGHHAGDQQAAVDAFLHRLGVGWSGSLTKDLSVWYFPDVEVVHYQARADARSVACVEFEATHKPSRAVALEAVERYERATGFDAARRSRQSLLHLLFPDVAARLG